MIASIFNCFHVIEQAVFFTYQMISEVNYSPREWQSNQVYKKSKLGQLMQEGSIESQAIRTRLSAAFGEVQKVKEGNNILLNKKLKCYTISSASSCTKST